MHLGQPLRLSELLRAVWELQEAVATETRAQQVHRCRAFQKLRQVQVLQTVYIFYLPAKPRALHMDPLQLVRP
jgi:DNA-binding response OmpR family regulator